MDATLQVQTAFHLTGRRPAAPLEPIERLGLRPALLARYRDLTRLRHDFPLVLVEPAVNGCFVRSLTDVVNELARDTAPAGAAGEALRKQLLHVEREIRRAVTAGASGQLSDMWKAAVWRVAVDGEPELVEVLQHAGDLIRVDGEVVDCDQRLPERLLAHAWEAAQRDKLDRARRDINGLVVRLSDILRADFVRSDAGRQPASLQASVGTRQQGLFDFDMMARLLALGSPASRLSDTRRRRIEWALAVLRSQRFFPDASAHATGYEFRLDTCRAVLSAFRERLSKMAELVKAMSLAELEADGRYDESRHDAFFDAFDEDALSPKDMELFPDYFVALRGRPTGAADDLNLMQLLSSGISVKVLVETDDILEESSMGRGQFALGVRSVQLASLATGLTDTFVLQSTSSNLLPLAPRVERGMSIPGPALFSIYTASGTHAADLPRYLASAAAMQSRAFPAFTYDPAAGTDLASRFSLEDNPQPERDWPVAAFEYADASLQRVSEDLAFTLADFVATDPRYAGHFARVPHEAWNGHMVPLAGWVASASTDGGVPYVLAVDADDVLHRLIVDDRLVQAARRCLDHWHRLQEFGGIHNSHAERLLARERASWEELHRQPAPPPVDRAKAQTALEAVDAAVPAPAATVAAEPARSPDEAWIETIRCSSCNECTQVNDRMFAYNDDKQAYIRDVRAGTFRELVEAAESCQLSIIHPGRPVDPKEQGLEELLERARPFA